MSLFVDIEKKIGSFRLKVKFETGDGTTALLGASGCGKSMTLKCIAGIEKPDRGRIVLNGVTLFDSGNKINLPPQARKTGFLFQSYALFPNMTVRENILAGTKRWEKKKNKNSSGSQNTNDKLCSGTGNYEPETCISSVLTADERAEEIMKRFDISHLGDKLPSQLSGGEQQRTALARILVSDPEILLLDEPFSALDRHLRFRLEQEVREVIREFGKTVILVSHDRDEVFRLSDDIVILNDGKVDVAGTKKEVFRNPHTGSAALVTGCKNISPAKVLDDGRVEALNWNISIKPDGVPASPAFIGIRANEIRILSSEGFSGTEKTLTLSPASVQTENVFHMKLIDIIENPFTYTLLTRPAESESGESIYLETDKEWWKNHGSEYFTVYIPPESVILMEK